jgi:hypothetical protein
MSLSFNLNPPFPGDVEELLKTRSAYIQGRRVGTQYMREDGALDYNYRRYAYIYLTSKKSGKKNVEDDATSLFDTYDKAEVVIGNVPDGGHMDLYESEGGVRRLKPQITSVSINQDGGGDIYNSFIKEVEVQFSCYSLPQLERIEENFFRLGSEVRVDYGWLDPINSAETGGGTMSVYNFGFSMASDGSYNCNIKGLIGDAFGGATRMGGLMKLSDNESEALGKEGANPADISMALIAMYKVAFGLEAGEDASKSSVDDGDIEQKKSESDSNVDLFMAGIMNLGESESIIPFAGDDPIRTPFTNLKSIVYLANKLSGASDKETFKFTTDANLLKISPNRKDLGSADPRKYILPGDMSDYGEGNEYPKTLGGLPTDIPEILISINEITNIVKAKGSTVNDIFQPPKVVDILNDLSKRIANVTGGLVQLTVQPEGGVDDQSGIYIIQNKTQMMKQLKAADTTPFEFTTLGETSMVRDISVDTEFDADIMMFMTVGNIKNGNIDLATLQTIYPNIPEIKVDPKTEEEVKEAAKKNESKQSVGKDGIDDSKANALATVLQKLVMRKEEPDSPNVILPFQLKLGVTLDGIASDSMFLAPITADRLPARFRSNVKFLVTGMEHSFDGQGGWTTNLKTVMTMMKD